jgi:Na+-transporting NADH:ubiquinone oxidoreductase subunit NqrB
MVFGGLGANIFNPAMAGPLFLTASFGILMTTWTVPATLDRTMPTVGPARAQSQADCHKQALTQIAADSLFSPGSVQGSPSWWPRSTRGYSVFEGQDDQGGGLEVWIPQDGPTVYLYRFLE